jgi:hypothetical protein
MERPALHFDREAYRRVRDTPRFELLRSRNLATLRLDMRHYEHGTYHVFITAASVYECSRPFRIALRQLKTSHKPTSGQELHRKIRDVSADPS